MDGNSGELGATPRAATTFLECLSLIEYTGAKWIMAVPPEDWDAQLRDHATDEMRHGKVMSDEARRIRSTLSGDDLVRERSATERGIAVTEKYLERLIARSFKHVLRTGGRDRKEVRCYAYLSLLIERRLMKIYHELAEFGVNASLRQIAQQLIEDERGHLAGVTGHCRREEMTKATNRSEFIAIEEELGQVWLAELMSVVQTPAQ
jgi:rubrerythrin